MLLVVPGNVNVGPQWDRPVCVRAVQCMVWQGGGGVTMGGIRGCERGQQLRTGKPNQII